MNNKHFIRMAVVIGVVIMLAIALGACSRSASNGPPTSSDATFPVPGESDETMGDLDIDQINTQTAIAAQMEGAATATQPPPLAVTATPEVAAPAPTQEPQAQPGEPQPGESQPQSGESQAQPAATAVPPIQVEPTPGIPSTYTLQKGEFPYCIARRFNVNQTELLNINGLNANSVVGVGMTLKIPQTGNHFSGTVALNPHPTTYTVKTGDSIYTIACRFGDVSPDMIAIANGLKEPYSLSAGQVLQIP